MYRHCIYCSAALGANEALEGFPVGRSIAFDAGRGRLWAVCPRCARWNLAPLEERWEVVEAAEKRFRDTRLRAQRENVGVAKLADGTRLVRIGAALPGEVAAWRYGEGLRRRRREYLEAVGMGAALGVLVRLALPGGSGVATAVVVAVVQMLFQQQSLRREAASIVVHRFPKGALPHGAPYSLEAKHMEGAKLVPADGGGFDIHVPHACYFGARDDDGRPFSVRYSGFVLCGDEARSALGRTMASINLAGGTLRTVRSAVERVGEAHDAADFLRREAERGTPLAGEGRSPAARWAHRLALEMALHDEQERRALDGELALLESAWREAEEIAGIADRLAGEDGAAHPPHGESRIIRP